MTATASAAPRRPRTWAGVESNPQTYRQVVAAHLATAEHALGSSSSHLIRELDPVLGAWADEPVEAIDRHTSNVGNDGSPVELSLAFSHAGVQPRVLFEPLDIAGPAPTSDRRHLQRLERLGLGVKRLNEIAGLFLPDGPAGPSAAVTPGGTAWQIMHAVDAPLNSGPGLHKIYLNPAATGRPATDVVAEAMRRLDLGAGWARLVDRVGVPLDPVIVGLDLTNAPGARIKVYLRHCGRSLAEIEEIELVSRAAGERHPRRFSEIAQAVSESTRWAKAPLTCLNFSLGTNAPCVTLHCPLDPVLPNDEVACQRVEKVLSMARICSARFTSVARAICGDDARRSRRLSWLGYKADPVVNLYAGLEGMGMAGGRD